MGGELDEEFFIIEDQPPTARKVDIDQSCCWMVRLWFTIKNYSWNLHSSKFGYYKMEPGLVNGRPHYTSLFANGKYALAFCGTHWNVQLASHRGLCRGFISYGGHNNECPHYPSYQWKYLQHRIGRWARAGE